MCGTQTSNEKRPLRESLPPFFSQASTSSNGVTPEMYSTHVASFAAVLRSMDLVDEENDKRIGTYVSNLPKLCAAKQCQVITVD